MLKKQTKLK